MTQEVTGCKDCPFFIRDDFNYCTHPSLDEPYIKLTEVDSSPYNCPLKTESITIKLKENE